MEIKNVLGFNFELNLIDNSGNQVKSGFKTTYPKRIGKMKTNIVIEKDWFTNFDKNLYEKYLDCQKNL